MRRAGLNVVGEAGAGSGKTHTTREAMGMLCYVAGTRARLQLDPSGVHWVDEWLAAFLPHAPSVRAPDDDHVR